MEVGKTLYVTDRNQWRKWLQKHHNSDLEIWLVSYRKSGGKPSIPYNNAVEEALCFGWIDSIVKKLGEDSRAQRFSPRKMKSKWSETNLERVRRLIDEGRMTPAGLAAVGNLLDREFNIPADILETLRGDPEVWNNFQQFPDSYKRIRVGWIDAARRRPEAFTQRLDYFLKMTKRNEKFGMVQ